MKGAVFCYVVAFFIGETVFTEIGASIVPTEVAAFDTAAPPTVTLVGHIFKDATVCLAENIKRQTAFRFYSVIRVIGVVAANLHGNSVFTGDFPQFFGYSALDLGSENYGFRHRSSQMRLHFDKTDNTAVDIACKAVAEIFERFEVPFFRIRFA